MSFGETTAEKVRADGSRLAFKAYRGQLVDLPGRPQEAEGRLDHEGDRGPLVAAQHGALIDLARLCIKTPLLVLTNYATASETIAGFLRSEVAEWGRTTAAWGEMLKEDRKDKVAEL